MDETPGLPGAASQARWTGTPLAAILDEASLLPGPSHVVFEGLDRGLIDGEVRRGRVRLSLDLARSAGVLLAWALNGEPLPLEHGYPVRVVVPGREERASLRWLSAISVVEGLLPEGADPAPLEPQARFQPPGLRDLETGRQVLDRGAATLSGRAWCGGVVAGVELAIDGETWQPAALEASEGPGAWAAWSAPWTAVPGVHRLACRALDERRVAGAPSFVDVEVRG